MDIGFGLVTCQHRPDDPRPTAALYDELLTLARASDRAGLDGFWTSEHHFMDDGYLSGVLPALAAAGTVTDDLRVGTYVALAPLHDAIRLAEDAATVDLLTDGRLTLGLGLGYRPEEFDSFGVPLDERPDRLADAIALLREAWTPGPVDHESTFHPIEPGTTVTPKPVQEPHPPIMIGAKAPQAVERAARIGDAWCAPGLMPLAGIEKRVDHIREVREEHGLDDEFTIHVARYGFVADSAESAWDRMKDGFLYGQRMYEEVAEGATTLSRDRQAELRDQVLIGPPTEIAAEIERFRERLDEDVHFMFRGYHPGLDTETMVECIDRLGDEVVPSL